MTWVEPWASRAPLFDANGVPFSDGIAEVFAGCDAVSVRAVLAVRRTKDGVPKPVLYCTGPDGRSVRYAPGDVRVLPCDSARSVDGE